MITRVQVRSHHLETKVLRPAQKLMDQVQTLAIEARAQDNGPTDLDSRRWRVDTPTLKAEIRCQGEDPLEGVMRLEAKVGDQSYSYHREGYDEHFESQGYPHVIRNHSTGVLTILED